MICIHLMGGLGNQLFQYAMLKSQMLANNDEGIIELSGISGIKKRGHNVFTLNNFNIDKNIKIVDKKRNIKLYINYIIYIFYYVFLNGKKSGYTFIKKIQPIINRIGCYCIPNEYLLFSKMKCKNNYLFGYFQAFEYFRKYEKEIRTDLKVSTPIMEQNKKWLEEIRSCESVCIHIRRGDYIGTDYEVCTIDYYMEAMKKFQTMIPGCKFYIFSNDIDWAKKNIVGLNIKYIDNKNPNYEELRLMYSCKHFIMSNSSFSWWAQFLSDNSDKKVVAPSKWNKKDNCKNNIYDDRWILMDV